MKRWLPLLAVVACTSNDAPAVPPSSTFDSASLFFPTEVESNGLEVLVVASVGAVGQSSVTLGGGDALFVEASDAARQPLVRFGGSQPGYGALLPTQSAEVTLELVRASSSEQAVLKLPPAFTIVAPPSPAHRSAPMTFTWDPSPQDGATISLSGCGGFSRALGIDVGAFTFQAADFSVTGPCTLQVTITRQRTIAPTSSFPRTNVTTTQVRTVRLETVP